MYLGDTHLDGYTHVDHLMREFDVELDRIVRMHRYVVVTAARDFTTAYNRHLSLHNYEEADYDGGDAIGDAEEELGINPWDMERHFGLLSLARAVSLAEIVLARLAATCWRRPELTVFPNGKTWVRRWERLFYLSCLNVRFDVDDGGFGTLRAVRDLYIHGYGVAVNEAQINDLAAQLYRYFPAVGATFEESELGYVGVASFFGADAQFDPEKGIRDELLLGLPELDINSLAAYRALNGIRDHIVQAALAVKGGMREDIESSKFVKTVKSWWEHHARTPGGA